MWSPNPTIQPEAIVDGAAPVTQNPSLFPSGWQAAWGPIQKLTNPAQAQVVKPLTPTGCSGGKMAPISFFGTRKIPAPDPAAVFLQPNAPLWQRGTRQPSWWRPTITTNIPAPRFASKTRRFSDHPLPVPTLQANSANPVAQRPARIGGSTTTAWPAPNTTWPTFGVGGT